ncbi:mitogen-activated protein kinase kinase kinase 15 [Artemisia annua]|uniref:Mitogen-activated protein kinase kinase kinase 15 n=1 Tax=Artemisia annua TaxID=35608 RepID=A0A2U1MD85_ARTAN|nr:mitogen-activated protein kinase kinase kinase 15 [Artemisia annua]
MEYKKGPVIGHGSFATVSVATSTTGDVFAVKSTSTSLQKEQNIMSRVSSKHVIKYMGYDVSYVNNIPMYNLYMEYAQNGSVLDMIKKNNGSLEESVIRLYTKDILMGLDYLHGMDIVHCDIKCSNVLVCEKGVKIGDLGCAKIMEENGGKRYEFAGTPVFMSPEVARGEEQGFPADVWALGCSVIEMATGSHAWPEINDPVSGLYKIGYSGELPEFPKWLPEDGKDFLEKCLRIDVNERWSVKELLEHPFVCNLGSGFETRNSPTSILDQGFWECLSVSDVGPTPMVHSSGELPEERIRKLVEGSSSSLCLPNWEDDDEEDWIAVRSNVVDETNAENDDLSSVIVESISFTSSNVEEDHDVDLEMLAIDDEDFHVLEYPIVSRVVDFDNIIHMAEAVKLG